MAMSCSHMRSMRLPAPSFVAHQIRRSSVVEKVLLNAREEGKKFSVIVVDSQPLLEGTCHISLRLDHENHAVTRQKSSQIPYSRIKPNPLHICSPSRTSLPSDRCFNGSDRRTRPVLEWCCVFKSRNRDGRNDGQN